MYDFDDAEIAWIHTLVSDELKTKQLSEGERTVLEGILGQIADVENENVWLKDLFSAPPVINPKIQKLLTTKAPWEKDK